MRLLAPRHCDDADTDDRNDHDRECPRDEAVELLPMKDRTGYHRSGHWAENPVDDGPDLEDAPHRGISPHSSSPATSTATTNHPRRPSRHPSSSAGSTYSKSSGKRRTTTAQSAADALTDPTKRVREKISVLAVIVHLCKGNIGPGAMSLPNGFSKTGIYAAPLYFMLVALVSTYNMDLLLYCKRIVSPTRNMSFGDVAGKILGHRGKVLIDVFLVGTQLGICCVYFTFVATNIHVVLPEKLQSVIHERQLILAIFPIILMLSWIRTLNRITPFSSLANVAVFLGISIVFYYSIDYANNPTKPRLEPVHVDYRQFPEFYGTAVYSFEGIGLILPIQNEMRQPELFPRVLAMCMLAILVLFVFIGEVPTIAFGRITNGSMTAVLHEYCEGWLVTMANILLAFACLLSFPIQFYPAVDVLEKTLNKRGTLRRPETMEASDALRRQSLRSLESAVQQRRASATTAAISKSLASSTVGHRDAVVSSASQQRPQLPVSSADPSARLPHWLESLVCSMSQYECNRTIFRSMLCTGLMVIAICIPDVGLLISLFGAVGSSMLAIIIPPVMYIVLHQGELSIGSRILHLGIIVFGVLGMIAGTVQAMAQVISSFTSAP
ncbi:hypothetical protein P43SY_005148 [Pythium insidiosum]|uniref:Amino acid transporter transmembrane domain-containing protein n=1 Tax=Pythium insidiosum TaxID=114742 RepID=A0AAD5L943_PYTIN|nr:hypothetical protein P43SY_005148 [Pythium insidiosum]